MNTIQQLLALAGVITLTSIAAASAPRGDDFGLYAGIMFGKASMNNNVHYLPSSLLSNPYNASSKNDSFYTNLVFGYQVNPYISLESRYSPANNISYFAAKYIPIQLKTTYLDAIVNFSYPLGMHWVPTISAGFSLTQYLERYYTTTVSEVNIIETHTNGNARATIGAGLGYKFTPNWELVASARIYTAKKTIPATRIYTLGIVYHMVNLYCSQFLC